MNEGGRILVTGAEGLVGSALVRALLAAGHPVTTLSLPSAVPHDRVRVVRGDARDPEAVRTACENVVGVAHLAAIPHPSRGSAEEVFGNNVLATFTVLWGAAEAGVRRLAIASSVNATGLLLNPHGPVPDRYPVDETTERDLADPYSLSKHVDEATLATVCRRFDATGVALRLPLMVEPRTSDRLRAWNAEHPEEAVASGWSWLDTRDAAAAFRSCLVAEISGVHVLQLAAPTTLLDEPTDDALRRHAPTAAGTSGWEGHLAPVNTSRARTVLGFVPRHLGGEEGRQTC